MESTVTTEELSIANPTPAASTEATTTETSNEGATENAAEQGTEAEAKEAKPEKTEAERERMRMQRGIDRRTRQLEEARAEARQLREQLTQGQSRRENATIADDSEPLTLTRAELYKMVKTQAEQLAPTLREQAVEVERRQGVVESLAKTWGKEKFDEVSSDLDDAFGGLTDRSGSTKPAIEAVFEADEPAKVIEYLIDPDNLEEAERISKMSAAQASKAITKLEAKLASQPAKPSTKVSKAPAPLEPVQGKGGGVSTAPDPKDTKAWIKWSNEQERKGL